MLGIKHKRKLNTEGSSNKHGSSDNNSIRRSEQDCSLFSEHKQEEEAQQQPELQYEVNSVLQIHTSIREQVPNKTVSTSSSHKLMKALTFALRALCKTTCLLAFTWLLLFSMCLLSLYTRGGTFTRQNNAFWKGPKSTLTQYKHKHRRNRNLQRHTTITSASTASNRQLQGVISPFLHGVASGDPTTNAVILWTRVSRRTILFPTENTIASTISTTTSTNKASESGSVTVSYTVATSPEFNNATIAATGMATTDANQDYTIKVDVTGLQPYTYYYYKFTYCSYEDPTDCVDSVVGRTKTAPDKDTPSVNRLRFASVSCSSYQWGYFHAYDAIRKRDDIDAVIHLGDYIYETAPWIFGDVRQHLPPKKLESLSDFRTRYKQYREDSSLQQLHQYFPFITTWDDHEFENQGQDFTDEEIRLRQNAAQAYREWMPFRPRFNYYDNKVDSLGRFVNTPAQKDAQPWEYNLYRKLQYGSLVDIFVLDNRIAGRDENLEERGYFMFLPKYYDPDQNMLGNTQMEWLKGELRNSQAQWKVIAQTVVMSPVTVKGIVAHNSDAWDGYYADRAELLGFIDDNQIDNVVVMSGDIHSSAVADLPKERTDEVTGIRQWWNLQKASRRPNAKTYKSVAVEFVVTSVSAGTLLEDEAWIYYTPYALEAIDWIGKTLGIYFNPHVKFFNSLNKGYQILDFNASRVQTDIYYTGSPEDIVDSVPVERQYQTSFYSANGANAVQPSNEESLPYLER